jgi:hypothetical protein
VPTILRFRGFNIVIYTRDHEPAHVHARGAGVQAIFLLPCAGGEVEVRGRFGTSQQEEAMLARFIEENRDILCKAWEDLHGDAGKA